MPNPSEMQREDESKANRPIRESELVVVLLLCPLAALFVMFTVALVGRLFK